LLVSPVFTVADFTAPVGVDVDVGVTVKVGGGALVTVGVAVGVGVSVGVINATEISAVLVIGS